MPAPDGAPLCTGPAQPAADPHGPEAARGARVLLWLTVALMASMLLWAAVGRLDIVSTAAGEVIPSTKVKSVQHLEGGIIRAINVREGDEVRAGQALVELEETFSGSSVEELGVRMTALRAEVARLDALAGGLETPAFPEDLAREHPALVAQNRELFEANVARLGSELAVLRETVVQRGQDIVEIEARLRNNQEGLRLVREQIAISEELLREQLTTQYKHLAFKREESQLVSAIEQDRAGLPRARSALAEAREKLRKTEAAFREDAREELLKKRQELEEFSQRMRKFEDSLQRTVIRSPVDGVVKKLHFVTVGGVVQAGETLVDVVPSSDRLVVEAHLPISDIGYVQPGQRAMVRLASHDSARFGRLEGRVVHVSPDTFVTPDGATYYSVRIETEGDGFRHGDFEYRLIPGMLVVAAIHTGRRTVLQYLLDPFLGSLGEALQER
ncbi:HlyD family type I secretion periplasmic adaptor subunit [Desulfocurvus sp.]|uniref:HlyD family type I secretion periplasmic adaptor subunit n=1 Tax=Desulfocurvus sp. TaxID=2871698 RepID=UPI0025C63B53|nr:HlyD family type I secretion periplasmic adaptor subunit [Desulfocurvus sp.]MCK9240125.1 HlyD family type I secretion periplasmic adaptor subunit [Desulfocurvus sp.]